MTGRAVANEFAKMRRLHVAPVVVMMMAGVIALSCVELIAPGFAASVGDPSGQPWQRLLAGLALAVSLVSPLLLAVLASRQVDIEHQGNGWLLAHTAGLAPGQLCRVKFVATGAVLAVATVAQIAVVIVIGELAGITVAFPAGQWAGYTASVLVVNLVLLGVHLLVSARFENQLVSLGVGVLGTFLAVSSTGMPSWVAHLSPWGYYAVATPVDYRGGDLVSLAPSYPSLLALAAVGAAVFVAATGRLDRQEV